MATPYSPTTPTPPWPSPSTVNQHRSNLSSKRKADAIGDNNDIDSISNSSISSQFKKLRLNQQRNGVLNPNLNIAINNSSLNAHHQNGNQQMQPQMRYQYQQESLQGVLTPTSPTSKYSPHIVNTDVRPALPPLPPDPTLARHSSPSPSLLPSPTLLPPRTPTPTARPTRGPTALATSYRRLHDPPAARELPLSPPDPSPRQHLHTRNSSIASSIMAIDETPNRIIINDLEAEIAAIEADEAASRNSVFIADIDKKVSAIPQRLLQNSSSNTTPVSSHPSAGPGSAYPLHSTHQHSYPIGAGAGAATFPDPSPPIATALVLYKDPTSISVPESEDVVRKTIIAARQRAREKAMEDQRDRDHERQRFLSEYRSGRGHGGTLYNHGGDPDFYDDAMTDHSSLGGDFDDDPDAMDIE